MLGDLRRGNACTKKQWLGQIRGCRFGHRLQQLVESGWDADVGAREVFTVVSFLGL